MSGVKTRHPEITEIRRKQWRRMRDAMEGEEQVKFAGREYLPMPPGFKGAADGGVEMYDAYRGRARFPAFVSVSVPAMIGIIHGREAQIEMPGPMEYLWENADGEGLPLEAFHRRITRELLVIGGYGILTDAPQGGGDPYLAGVSRDRVINWDTDFWVLDETRLVRRGFDWEQVEQYRVLTLEDGVYVPILFVGGDSEGERIEARGRGNAPLPRIPFAIGSAVDLSPKIQAPPLIGVVNAAVEFYQLSADRRHQLHMSGQETLVAINGDAPDFVGAGVVHEMRGAEGLTPDLRYVSPSCSGIESHRAALIDAREAAVMAGARLFEQSAPAQESGTARKLRFASETATLLSVAHSSSALLERALRNAAMIMGLDEEEVVVTPPADLLDQTMSSQDFAALFGVYREGGMSWETFFANGQRGGIFSEEDGPEDEFARIDNAGELGDNVI